MPSPTSSLQSDRRFYVYVLFRLDGSPCYVGKGKGSRWTQHENHVGEHPNRRLAKIIEAANGRGLPKVKIRQSLTNAEACAIERAFIAAIGRGHRGPLVNMTDGGEGALGRRLSEEARKRIGRGGEKRRGRKTGPHSPERKAAISAAKLGKHINYPKGVGAGKPKTEGHRLAMSEAAKRACARRGRAMIAQSAKIGWAARRASGKRLNQYR